MVLISNFRPIIGFVGQILPSDASMGGIAVPKDEFIAEKRYPVAPPRTKAHAERRKASLEKHIQRQQSCKSDVCRFYRRFTFDIEVKAETSWGRVEYFYLKITPKPKMTTENQSAWISHLILGSERKTGIVTIKHNGSVPETMYAFFLKEDADDFRIP
ncbi:MAG: hypothetical protein HN337_00240 [Deltaproteobacteria bacterium]|jgi:hypothetical protein|nr:hypothetical protein [Deltaproteobacteria bacterium]